MHLSPDPWIWVAGILTIFVYSFLYKDNPCYKFAEHLLVGTAMGYGIALFWSKQFVPNVFDPLFTDFSHNWNLLFAILIGSFYLFRFIPKTGWLIRFPIAISLGFGSGLIIPLIIRASLLEQARHTMSSLGSYSPGDPVGTKIFLVVSSILIVVGVLSCLIYFYFSIKHTGVIGKISWIGIVFLMIGFGASFGNTVMARISLLIGRVGFILDDWLGLPIIQ